MADSDDEEKAYYDAEGSPVDAILNSENKKYPPNDIRSIEILKNNDDECDYSDIDDVTGLPEISSLNRTEDKSYEHLLAIGNGIYSGTINEKSLREGQGTNNINNGEEYYSGEWKDDKPNGYGFQKRNHGLSIYHGIFEDGILKEGYGKEQLSNDYEYKGEISNGNLHGLGSLSIKVDGVKNILKLIAEWKKGETEIVYKNDIEEEYKKQYRVFHNALENLILSNNENQQKQREYFQILIDLFENHLSDLALLNEITKNTVLTSEFKLAADLLYKLDDSYTKLSKYTKIDDKINYNNCIHDICLTGLKIYVRRLAWSDDENKNHYISNKDVFGNTINEFTTKSQLSELKKVLYINPSVVDLIKKLIRFTNVRAISISSQYRTFFTNYHIEFLQNLSSNYFKELNHNKNLNKFDYKNDEKYNFYSDCYSNLLELSVLNAIEIEIEIESKKLNVNNQNSYISVKRNGENVYYNTSNNNELQMIIFDGIIGSKKSEQIFSIKEYNNINVTGNKIDCDNIIVIILPYYDSETLDRDIINFFLDLGSTTINKLKENQTWVCMIRKSDNKFYEKISCNSVEKFLMKETFQFKLDDENISIDQKINKYIIDSIIYTVMKFSLDNFKPWINIDVKKWSDYLEIPISQDSSIKNLADGLLIKILQKSKDQILSFLQMDKNIDTEYSNQISKHLESMIDYYKKSLLKTRNFNYQNKMKEIKKMLIYFSQLLINKNPHVRNMIESQLKSIREFIEGKQSITEIIDHFLNFNNEFLKLSNIFQEKFSSDIHSEFYKKSSTIILSITDILKLVLGKEEIYQSNEETQINHSDLLRKYDATSRGIALERAAFQGNLIDVKILLESGIDINEQNDDTKRTALHWAVINKHKPVISYLLEKGANIEIKDKSNQSSIDYAKKLKIDLNLLNRFQNTLFAMQKLNNFLPNLVSSDINWYVEHSKIKNYDPSVFENARDNHIYKVKNINVGKIKLNSICPYYALDAIIELLEIIENSNIINDASVIEMIKLRGELIMAIGKSFNYFKDQIKYNDLAKFKEDCVNPFEHVIIDNNSYQTFSNKLEKLDLYFLYNRKLKEITIDRALEEFQKKNQFSLNTGKITEAFKKYEEKFKKYLNNIIRENVPIKNIVEKIKKKASESQFTREAIPRIIAGLSVILSLTVSDLIEKHGSEFVLKEKHNMEYLLQPHCIQILGVLILLDSDGDSNSLPPNHLAEILTGQGKSWALALLGGYFSLLGYKVTVGCYSDYLSKRDENDFNKNLQPFNFTNVKYRTFKTMCNERLSNIDSGKDLRSVVSTIISGRNLSSVSINRSKEEKSIFLIDEVDVFFSHQFGEMYHPGTKIYNENISQFQLDIWENIMTNKSDEIQWDTFLNQRISNLINKDKILSYLNSANSLKSHLQEMIDYARRVYKDMYHKNILKDKYEVRDDNKMYAKISDGTYSLYHYFRYENSFYYLKFIYEKYGIFTESNLNKSNFGYIAIRCGRISYSEIPKIFNGIFGVSGSLKDLSEEEKKLLKHYDIDKKSYYPSFFGQTKLIFNENTNFIIEDNKKDWFNTIVTNTRKKLDEERSILIFFINEIILREFYKSYSGDLGADIFYITPVKIYDGNEEKYYNDNDVNKLIKDEYAGHHGKVTLLTREFGRGVDFQAETKVNEKGGMHVIQTFFSEDIKEEIQIKGRTARKDEKGSYELILYLEHLQNPESEGGTSRKYENITKHTTYDELDKKRKENSNLFCKNKLEEIEKNKEIHNRTLDFFRKVITTGCDDSNRKTLIEEIAQLGKIN